MSKLSTPPRQDSAIQARRRMQQRTRRRLVKDILKRSAQSRRLVFRTMAAGLAALVAAQLAFTELVALAG
ncbi:MAG: hypothetical protein ACREWI_14305 [Telluria sp.]